MDAHRLDRILRAIGSSGDQDPATYQQRVCSAAVELLQVDGSGLTLVTADHLGAIWASNDRAHTFESLQLSLAEGPALDVVQYGAPALEPNLMESLRWPFFGPKAIELGVSAVFSFPLQIGVIRLGALNLFRDKPGFLSVDELADALVLADVATQDILDLQAQGALQLPQSDRPGAQTRVHQATGMVSVQIGTDMAAALACIRAHAFTHELSIFQVADEVIARRLRLTVHP